MQWLATFTTFFSVMVLVRSKPTFTHTIVLAKIKTILCSNTWYGVLSPSSTLRSHYLSSVGHTKLFPDWCFGLLKCWYRRIEIESLRDIAEAVNQSAECNFAQFVSHEDGSTIVTSYDWTDYFASRMKKVPVIEKLHHFRMTSLLGFVRKGVIQRRSQSVF